MHAILVRILVYHIILVYILWLRASCIKIIQEVLTFWTRWRFGYSVCCWHKATSQYGCCVWWIVERWLPCNHYPDISALLHTASCSPSLHALLSLLRWTIPTSQQMSSTKMINYYLLYNIYVCLIFKIIIHALNCKTMVIIYSD